MDKNYKETIQDLEEKINELSKSGISIQSLNSSVEQLKKHTENVEKIEENIEAIREEVIDKIKDEIQYNKKAGSFSIYGFWVGSIALVMSIWSIGKDLFKDESQTQLAQEKIQVVQENKIPDSIVKKIDIIDYKINEIIYNTVGFSDKYEIKESEFLLEEETYNDDARQVILKDSLYTIEIAVKNIREEKSDKQKKKLPTATLVFYVDNKKIGRQGIREIFQKNNLDYYLYDGWDNGAIINERDSIRIFRDYFVVEKIYLKNSETRRVGSDKNAVLIKKVKDGEYGDGMKAYINDLKGRPEN